MRRKDDGSQGLPPNSVRSTCEASGMSRRYRQRRVSANIRQRCRQCDDQRTINWRSGQTKENAGQLLMYEVSRLLRAGTNAIAVRLSPPLATEQPTLGGESPEFFLDGWVEGPSRRGNLAVLDRCDVGSALTEPTANWYQGARNKGRLHLYWASEGSTDYRASFAATLRNSTTCRPSQSVWDSH